MRNLTSGEGITKTNRFRGPILDRDIKIHEHYHGLSIWTRREANFLIRLIVRP